MYMYKFNERRPIELKEEEASRRKMIISALERLVEEGVLAFKVRGVMVGAESLFLSDLEEDG